MKKRILSILLFISLLTLVFFSNVKASTNKAKIYIDFPTQNQNTNQTLSIHGWFMSEIKDKSLKFYIDNENTEIKSGIKRYARGDVTSSVKGYGTPQQNPQAGFDGKVDISNLKDGKHTLIVRAIDNKTGEKLGEEKQTFNLKKDYKTNMWIDWPNVNETVGTKVKVHGWVMSNLKDKNVKIYLDNENTDITSKIKRYARGDVTSSVKGYGTAAENPEAGFDGEVDISNLKDGKHKIIVKVINAKTNETMAQSTREFNVRKYNTSLWIDWPNVNETVGTKVKVHGWVMSNLKDKNVKIYLDNENTDITSKIKRYARGDVTSSVKGYGTAAENPEAGFDGEVDISNLKDGKHKIIVKVINVKTNEIMAQSTREFNLQKYKTSIWIDFPFQGGNYRNTLNIHGWVMSEESDKEVRFYLNNNNITSSIKRYARGDVTSTVKGYGTPQQNPQAGFDGTINISGYSMGQYTLKVEVYSKRNSEVIGTAYKTFSLNSYTYVSGAFGMSGLKEYNRAQGGDLIYHRIGDGKNVMFAVFSTHGFEDSWGKDGQELTYIADQFISHLKTFQANYKDILNNWTIYIIPKLNYDGQSFGWSNNGPGRTTIRSDASGHKGIDLNRCWSVSYKSYRDDRNYSGTAPFQACESRYLREFMLSYKSKNGKTIVVDLHGWLNETIGDNGLGWFYRDRYGIKQHIGTYGGGYLVNWARTTLSNTRSVLVELPMVSNHNQVVSQSFAEKYIQATTNMLRNN